jgi:CheY-like chemotaxis protein
LILLTSVGRVGGDTAMQKLGLDAALVKPVRQSELYNCLITVLGVTPLEVGAALPAVPHATKEEGKGVRVLLAEDNAVNQKLALRLLSQMGYRADVAGNGIEAIQALERQPYDVVLMDVQMPAMDGFQTTAAIRALPDPAKSRVPIVAMTAHALPGYQERCLAAGMNGYLSKPLRSKVLIELVERLAESSAPA